MGLWAVPIFWLLWVMMEGMCLRASSPSLWIHTQEWTPWVPHVSGFSCLRNCQTLSQCWALKPPQQQGVPLLSPQHLLLCRCCRCYSSHSDRCGVISHCGFGLLFPSDQWRWVCFYVLIGHLGIMFGEMSMQDLCPFSNWVISLSVVKLEKFFIDCG